MPTDIIAEQVTVGAVPASPNGAVPAVSGTTATLRADIRQEYISGTSNAWYTTYLRTLPRAIDDVTADFGDDLFERMLKDAHVAANINGYKASVLETGATLTSAVSDETEDGFDLAKLITDSATDMLKQLETPLDDVLWDMYDALALGNRVAELTYDYRTLQGTRRLALKTIKVKERTATAFVVDAYGTVVGLLGLFPGMFSPVQIGTVVGDPEKQPNLLPREKFAILTNRPRNGDPRGTSLLRSAYAPWWMKQQLIGEYLKYISQFATPSVIGYTPEGPGAVPQPLRDSLGNLILDGAGNPQMTTAEQAMAAALQQWRNSMTMVFKGGAKVDLVQSQGEGEAFSSALSWCNHEMTMAIQSQSLSTDEGKHQARAAASVHQDLRSTLVTQSRAAGERMIQNDMLKPWVKWNWGERALRFVPNVSLGTAEKRDFAQDAEAVAKLYACGYISESQKAELDKRLDLPERDPDFDAAHAKPLMIAVPTRAAAQEGEPPVAPPAPGQAPQNVTPMQKPTTAKAVAA